MFIHCRERACADLGIAFNFNIHGIKLLDLTTEEFPLVLWDCPVVVPVKETDLATGVSHKEDLVGVCCAHQKRCPVAHAST
jgi:hypothetical protein